MKILLPTDFSKLSKIAIDYAIGLSKDFDLELVVLHIASDSTPHLARIGSKKIGDAIKASTDLSMKRLMESIKEKHGSDLKLTSQIIYSASAASGVNEFVERNDIDIICIGNKGETRLKKTLFGSNAAAIISSSSKPVLTIPEDVEYKKIENLLYSSDLENSETEFGQLLPFVELIDPWVHILHILKISGSSVDDLQNKLEELKTNSTHKKVKTKMLESKLIVNAINEYAKEVNADVIVLFARRASLFNKLFNKSVTREEVSKPTVPLLTFQKS